MKCPKCVSEGLASNVYPGVGVSTAMYCAPFYDEQGIHHHHDLNTTSRSYSCSNGHSWRDSEQKRCPAPDCDWNKSGIAPEFAVRALRLTNPPK